MPAPLILTFAELEFLLACDPSPTDEARAWLRLAADGPADGVVAAGLASLLARGLCATDPTAENPLNVTLRPEVLVVAAALASGRTRTSVAGWIGEKTSVVHFLDTPQLRLAFRPGTLGRFAVDFGDGAEPLSKPVSAFVDWCAAEGGPAAVVVASTSGERTLGFAVALEPGGRWFMSDSGDSPDRGKPVPRTAVRERVAALLDVALNESAGESAAESVVGSVNGSAVPAARDAAPVAPHAGA